MNLSIDNTEGRLFAVCGNSGSGKSTLVRHVLSELPPGRLQYLSTYTTRERRPNEDNFEYIFVNEKVYLQKRDSSSLWDESIIYDNYYGTDASYYLDAMAAGENFVVCSVPSLEIIDDMRSIYGKDRLSTIHLRVDAASSGERAAVRDGTVNLGRLAVDLSRSSDFISDYDFHPSGSIERDRSNFKKIFEEIM